jgi:peptidoglycan LD-endopeptidase LytH
MRPAVSRMALGDRLKTIAVTAALTSVAWIGVWLSMGSDSPDSLMTIRREPAAQGAKNPSATRPATPTGAPLEPVTARDLPPSAADYIVPVVGIRPDQLTDTFSDARGGGSRVHEAIDIMAPTGTPVVAATGGTIEKLFQSDAGGLTIYIRSPDRRTITYYAHLDAYAPGLREGQKVRPGERLGTVGYSGNASPAAPHLHFAILRTTPQAKWWEPATAINPYPVLTRR